MEGQELPGERGRMRETWASVKDKPEQTKGTL